MCSNVHAKSFQSVLENYSVLHQLWQCVPISSVDRDVRARVTGVQALTETFDYFFGVCIGKLVLGHADNLSAALQKSTISVAEGKSVGSNLEVVQPWVWSKGAHLYTDFNCNTI